MTPFWRIKPYFYKPPAQWYWWTLLSHVLYIIVTIAETAKIRLISPRNNISKIFTRNKRKKHENSESSKIAQNSSAFLYRPTGNWFTISRPTEICIVKCYVPIICLHYTWYKYHTLAFVFWGFIFLFESINT